MRDIRVKLLSEARALWRRRWYGILIAWIVCMTGWAMVVTLPNQYRSEARIYVNTETLLRPLLRGITVSYDLDQQVTYMKNTLLSRPNLMAVVQQTDLGLRVRNDRDLEGMIQSLSRQVQIRSQGKNLFSISYTDRDPRLAQRVTQTLVTMFVENNLGENRTDMENARSFLEDQVAEYERKLQTAEARLAAFKTENLDLISTTGSYVARAEAARTALNNARAALDDAVAQRNQLRSQLATVPEYLVVETMPQFVGGTTITPLSSLEARIREAATNLDALQSRFTDQHPDVIAAKRTMEMLHEQYGATVAAMEENGGMAADQRHTTRVPNGLYEQVKLRLVEAEATVSSYERRVAQAETDLGRLEALAQSAPGVEAKLADLNRDYDVIRRNYEDLLGRLESASIAQAVDNKSEVQFRIVDPPQVANIPAGPNRPLFISAVVLAGFGAGIGFLFLLVQLDDSFSTSNRLRETYGLPVLGAVSAVVTRASKRWRATELAGFATLCLCLFMVYVVLVVKAPYIPMESISNFTIAWST